MAQIIFNNPHFNKGRNVTVRKGTRWSGKLGKYEIVDRFDENMGYCQIVETKVKPFREILDTDIKYEHDPECRTLAGLLMVMDELYQDFNINDTVTIVDFKLISAGQFYASGKPLK